MLRAVLIFLVFAGPGRADTVLAARTVRSQAIVTADDVSMIETDTAGAYAVPENVIGMEARVVLYAGRPIRIDDIGPPAVIERNQIVTLYFRAGALTIATEARSLGRAGVGDTVRVMNLSSRNTVTGIVRADGAVSVGGPEFPTM